MSFLFTSGNHLIHKLDDFGSRVVQVRLLPPVRCLLHSVKLSKTHFHRWFFTKSIQCRLKGQDLVCFRWRVDRTTASSSRRRGRCLHVDGEQTDRRVSSQLSLFLQGSQGPLKWSCSTLAAASPSRSQVLDITRWAPLRPRWAGSWRGCRWSRSARMETAAWPCLQTDSCTAGATLSTCSSLPSPRPHRWGRMQAHLGSRQQ